MASTSAQTLRNFLVQRLDEETQRLTDSLEELEVTRRVVLHSRNPQTLRVLAQRYSAHPDFRKVM